MAASFSYFLAPATCLASQGYSVSAVVAATFQGEDDRTLGNFFLNFLFCIGVYLIKNVLVSGI